MKKIKMIIAATSLCSGVLSAGCSRPQETVIVQPTEKVIEKTTIKAAPRKAVVVKAKPQQAPTTSVKTEVKVNVAPIPTAEPKAVATPAPEVKIKPASTPRPTPVAVVKSTPTPKIKVVVKPEPTVAPRAKQKLTAKNLVVSAEVVATSRVPDPKSVPYKDALVFTKYKIISVQSGQYKAREILVAQWGMKDKKLLAPARHRVGQVQTLSLEPLADRTELDTVMRNDDTNEFDLVPYFAR